VPRVTKTTESSKSDAVTFSGMNFSGYVGHVTIFRLMLITVCCLVVGLGLELGLVLGLGLDSVSGWSLVMHTYL